MQLKTKSTANTEPRNRPHPEKIHSGPHGKNEEEDEDTDSVVRPDDFDLPEDDIEDEDVDDEIDDLEEAKRPG